MTPQQLLRQYATDPVRLLALCIYREARGESLQAKKGVASTVLNRCVMAPREGFRSDIIGNVLKPYAFSSFLPEDPNYSVFPTESDPVWLDCLAAAHPTIAADPTDGAVFYHDNTLLHAPSAWGTVIPTTQIGRLKFYKLPISPTPHTANA